MCHNFLLDSKSGCMDTLIANYYVNRKKVWPTTICMAYSLDLRNSSYCMKLCEGVFSAGEEDVATKQWTVVNFVLATPENYWWREIVLHLNNRIYSVLMHDLLVIIKR